VNCIRTITDIDECKEIWQKVIPAELVSDIWDVRFCFHSHYNNPPHFIVAEENNKITGFLPLSWNEESNRYNYFPGETWEGKTWLEQNRIIADNSKVFSDMLETLDRPYHIRYLRKDWSWNYSNESIDEIGYLFIPENFDYDFNRYMEAFSHKSAKRLKREIASWEQLNVKWSFNDPKDFEKLCSLNRSKYGQLSYFHDERFLNSFYSLLQFLQEREWLRMVTVSVDDEPAAVDMGSLYNGMLTMLAGGTNDKYRGIAKLINIHHITHACEQKLDSVDFLCGNFNWKTMFHLSPTPLYLIEGKNEISVGENHTIDRDNYHSSLRSEIGIIPNV